MGNYWKWVVPCLLVMGAPLWAQEGEIVLQVSPSQRMISVANTNTIWKINDPVCIFRDGKELACGSVYKIAAKGAIIRLNDHEPKIEKGDFAVLTSPPDRKVAAKEAPPVISSEQTAEATPNPKYHWDLSGGAGISPSFYFGNLNLQLALGKHFSVGTVFFLANASLGQESTTSLTSMLAVNFYSREPFRGLWIQLGAGPQLFIISSGAAVESVYTYAGILTVGWRGQFEKGRLNMGVGAGSLFVGQPATKLIQVTMSSIQPTLLFDIGLNF